MLGIPTSEATFSVPETQNRDLILRTIHEIRKTLVDLEQDALRAGLIPGRRGELGGVVASIKRQLGRGDAQAVTIGQQEAVVLLEALGELAKKAG